MTSRIISSPGQEQKLSLDCPATYRITIQGRLGSEWSDWFEGMTLSTLADSEGTRTILTGPVHDQAALHGLLNKLYGLGLPLLAIDCLEVSPANNKNL